MPSSRRLALAAAALFLVTWVTSVAAVPLYGGSSFDPTATLALDLSTTNGFGGLVAQTNVSLNGCALSVNLGGQAPPLNDPLMVISNSSQGTTSGQFSGGANQLVAVNGGGGGGRRGGGGARGRGGGSAGGGRRGGPPAAEEGGEPAAARALRLRPV